LQKQLGSGLYFNWDLITDRKRLVRDPYFFDKEPWQPHQPRLLIFDEIHKYARWKSYPKGVFDRCPGLLSSFRGSTACWRRNEPGEQISRADSYCR
jgi:hypothetical protein